MPAVALATCREFPDLDDEDRLLIPALAERGIDAVPAVWTDDGLDWSSFDAVVVRATWDYSDRRDEFLAWTERVDAVTRLLNAPHVIAWNTDKRYLRELSGAGVPVVPTRFVEPGAAAGSWLPEGDFSDVVVKPAVSCGSRDTTRHSSADVAAIDRHVQRLLDHGRTVMVQPYVDFVDTAGETALMFFDGQWSHAIRKGPLLARDASGEVIEGLFLKEQIDPREPSALEREVADAVMAAIPGHPSDVLYARVDLVPGPDGAPVLLELELTEPSLFLSYGAGAAGRLAGAIAARVP